MRPRSSSHAVSSRVVRCRPAASCTAAVLCALAVASPAARGATFTVDSNLNYADDDPGDGVCFSMPAAGCTLVAAIEEANELAGADRIHFDIGGAAAIKTLTPGVIYILTAGSDVVGAGLPPIEEELTIDGWTQGGPDYRGPPLIQIDGSSVSLADVGIYIAAGSCVLRGLAVNNFSDIAMALAGPGGNTVEGCHIGVNAAGGAARPNGTGISIQSPDNVIGGSRAGRGNVISGNDVGVLIDGANDNAITGNLIGPGADGASDLGNTGAGVRIVSGRRNLVGGLGAGEGNTIAFNRAGVVVVESGDPAIGNSIRGNSMFSNDALGIDLGPAGREANDPHDADTGPNHLQNHPVLTAATLSGGEVIVEGTLASEADSEYELDFFASQAGDGSGPARSYLGTRRLAANTNTTGAAFTVRLPLPDAAATRITATATRRTAPLDTSELSPSQAITVVLGQQVPGDCNQDGQLDISDASCLTGFLFLGTPGELPCGDGSRAHAANRALLDWQSDSRIDVSDAIRLVTFLFSGGSPHPLAATGDETRACVEIPGCPDSRCR